MKTVSGKLVLLKSEIKAIQAIRGLVLDGFDWKRNKKGNLIPKAKQISLGLDTLEFIIKVTE